MVRKSSSSQPRRKHRRLPTKATVASRVDRLERAQSQDISPGGMALLLPRETKVGDQLQFELELSDGYTCDLEGEICRVEDVGQKELHKVGLRWVNLNAFQEGALNSYCRSLRATIDGSA